MTLTAPATSAQSLKGGNMSNVIQDIRYTVRSLLRHPAFAIVIVCSLALGIGANTAIFSLVNAVLLKPLQFSDPDRLVVLWEDSPNIRTTGDPIQLVSSVRREIHAVDRDQPVSNIASMDELLDQGTQSRRVGMLLLVAFAVLSLLLAVIGIYAVLAFFVTQHRPEIGVRLALGAQTRNILGLVLKKGMRLTLIGVVLGLIGSFALTRLMASLLFGVSATDLKTFAALAATLTVVALLACYVPARRAAKVDPLVALRYE
jgi:putative ABC transport system permease protein